MQTLRNAENTRSFNNDKGIIYLPRQYMSFPHLRVRPQGHGRKARHSR